MSSKAERSVRLRLEDILEASSIARGLVAGHTFDGYMADKVRRLAVERCLEIISEASRYVPDGLQAQASEIPWRKVANIGNVLRHAYQALDDLQVYNIARDELPPLETAVRRLLPLTPG